MHVLFTTQESLAITTSLYFWYEFCDLFDPDVNAYFLGVLVRFYFFKLGLHWSKSVREGFFYFLCYKVLMMYETGVGNAAFDALFPTINQYLNVAKVAGELYSQRTFSVERLPRKERRKVRLSEVKQGVIREVETLSKSVLNLNFFQQVPKFQPEFQRYLSTFSVVNDYFDSKDHRAFQLEESPMNEGEDEDFSEVKNSQRTGYLRFTNFNPETAMLSHISPNEILYATLGVQEFKTQLFNFQRLKAEHPQVTLALLPKLKMKLPIDEFEFIDDNDSQW